MRATNRIDRAQAKLTKAGLQHHEKVQPMSDERCGHPHCPVCSIERDWEHSVQFMTEFDPSKAGPGLGE